MANGTTLNSQWTAMGIIAVVGLLLASLLVAQFQDRESLSDYKITTTRTIDQHEQRIQMNTDNIKRLEDMNRNIITNQQEQIRLLRQLVEE